MNHHDLHNFPPCGRSHFVASKHGHLMNRVVGFLAQTAAASASRRDGVGRRAHPEHRHDRQGDGDTPVESAPATDPVSRSPVDLTTAVATVYQGRAYYFESRENRDRFEEAPDQYTTVPKDSGKAVGHDHHGGCC